MAVGLQITKEKVGDKLTVQISGDLNVKTSSYLEEELNGSLGGVKELVLDFAGVEYISSAGLLTMEKTMRRQNGQMKLLHVNSAVKEIIRLAGFLQVIHVEEN